MTDRKWAHCYIVSSVPREERKNVVRDLCNWKTIRLRNGYEE